MQKSDKAAKAPTSPIRMTTRRREVSEARGIICCLAVKDFGYSAAEVAHALDLRRVSAGQCVIRGEKILDKNVDLRDKFIN